MRRPVDAVQPVAADARRGIDDIEGNAASFEGRCRREPDGPGADDQVAVVAGSVAHQ